MTYETLMHNEKKTDVMSKINPKREVLLENAIGIL